MDVKVPCGGLATTESLLRGSRALPTPPFRIIGPTRIVVAGHAFASNLSTTGSKLSPTTEMMVDRLHRRGGNTCERRQRRQSRGPQLPSVIDCSANQWRVILVLRVTKLAEGGKLHLTPHRSSIRASRKQRGGARVGASREGEGADLNPNDYCQTRLHIRAKREHGACRSILSAIRRAPALSDWGQTNGCSGALQSAHGPLGRVCSPRSAITN
jgi:hypothetical protein